MFGAVYLEFAKFSERTFEVGRRSRVGALEVTSNFWNIQNFVQKNDMAEMAEVAENRMTNLVFVKKTAPDSRSRFIWVSWLIIIATHVQGGF